ncbi:MAG: hypothetical protein KKA62_02060 [Nanoarchaeota archaeon]|nr:hypothetical protein [Nanoarchaeota archaeon]MBU1644093.1 hypothetical protein [Nanoarchaeota archaeon]MBU1976719.1 hypothetical protein [Nanoarchaeota archaeon]
MKYDQTKESPTGYVRIEREGDLVRVGSRIERVTRSGETVLQSLDTEDMCSWIRKHRGTIRYSPLQKTNETSNNADKFKGRYQVMPSVHTYASGIRALHKECRKDENSPHPRYVLGDEKSIHRPLTLGEILSARLQKPSLFDSSLISCTGIMYKKRSPKFKIIPLCEELITIPDGFNEPYLNVNYNLLLGEEFDINQVGRYINKHNRRADAKKNPLLLAAVGGDKDLLSDYVDEVFDELNKPGKKKGMAFDVRKNTATDELRALSIDFLNGFSDIYGDLSLCGFGSFLQVTR